MYLTKNSSGDVLLTLMLTHSTQLPTDYQTAQYSYFIYKGTGSEAVPGCMYGTSMVRSLTLNNGGSYYRTYTGGDANKVTVDWDSANPFARFTRSLTDNTKKGDLAKYILTPEEAEYQRTLTAGVSGCTIGTAYNNDAFGTVTLGTNMNFQNKAGYSDWKTDKLWLPSWAEVDINLENTGLWKASIEQRSNGANGTYATSSLLRSHWYTGQSDGIVTNNADASTRGVPGNSNVKYGVRPALHLNLSLADSESKMTFADPQNANPKTYDKKDLNVSDEAWYLREFSDPNIMQVEYLNEAGTAAATPNAAGKYTVRFTLQNTTNYTWATDDGKNYRDIIFEIKPKEVAFEWETIDNIPRYKSYTASDVKSGDSVTFSVNYKGTSANNSDHDSSALPTKIGWYTATASIDNPNYIPKSPALSFELPIRYIPIPTSAIISPNAIEKYKGDDYTFIFTYDATKIVLDRPSNYTDDDYTFNVAKTVATASKEGTYNVNVSLFDPDNTRWVGGGDGVQTITFAIQKANLDYEILEGETIDCMENTTKTINLGIYGVKNKDNIAVDLIATYNGALPTTLLSNVIYTKADDQPVALDLDLTKLITYGLWDLEIKLRDDVDVNKNYILNCNLKLNVKEETDDGSDVWRIMAGSSIAASNKSDGGTLTVNFTVPMVYDGRQYSVFLKPSATLGREVDTSYSDDGYTNGYKTVATNASNTQVGKYADTYTTYVRLKDNSGNTYTYQLDWEIQKAKLDLSKVRWKSDGNVPFSTVPTEMKAEIDSSTLTGELVCLIPQYSGITTGSAVDGITKTASVSFEFDASDPSYAMNYLKPTKPAVGEDKNYIFTPSASLTDFEWDKDWQIVKMTIPTVWNLIDDVDDNGESYKKQNISDDKNVVDYEYYLWDMTANQIGDKVTSIEVEENVAKYYVTKAIIKSSYTSSIEFAGGLTEVISQPFAVGVQAIGVEVSLANSTLTFNGNAQQVKLRINGALSESDFDIVYYDKNGTTPLRGGAPSDAGEYRVEVSLKSHVSGFYLTGSNVTDGVAIMEYEIKPISIDGSDDNWNDSSKPPSLQITKKQLAGIRYEYQDADGNNIAYESLKAGNTYKIRAVVTDRTNYAFADGSYETDWQEFTVSANEKLSDPSNPDLYQDDDNPPSGDQTGSGDNNGNGGMGSLTDFFNNIGDMPLWQLIASVISLIVILVCAGKGFGYASKRKQTKRITDSRYKTYYAGAFLGLAVTYWTVIACVLMGLAVVSIVFMAIMKSKYNKAIFEQEDARSEYERNKKDEEKENMRMMLMGMMGGNAGGAQGGFAYQQGLGADEMRLMINDAVSALLPGVQQYLPQQASTHDDEIIKSLVEGQKAIMQQLAEHKTTERIVEREVAATRASEDVIVKVVEKTEQNDETIKQLLKNQEKLMEKIVELSTAKPSEPQIIEKIVEVPVEVEKIVEKEVVKEVPVEVEKIVEVEKEVIKEVKVEVPVAAPPKPKKEVAPKLTLDEAYALLSKEQKKYFDGLKAYALSKDKCKEKKSTYFTVFGATTTNPILKLTIKKDTTVALLKMEDEFMKDLRRDASGDGTKVKVKETEIVVGDAQAFDTAKKMIDLREDQIERYADLLKEQRSVSKRK